MGIFENLPYANFHELNLDWIIKTLKLGVEYMEQVKEQLDALDVEASNSLLNKIKNTVTTPVVYQKSLYSDSEQEGVMSTTYTTLGDLAVTKAGWYAVTAQVTYQMDGGGRTDYVDMSTLMTFQDAEENGLGHTARESAFLSGSAHEGSSLAQIVYLPAGANIRVSAAQVPVSDSDTAMVGCSHLEIKAYKLNFEV